MSKREELVKERRLIVYEDVDKARPERIFNLEQGGFTARRCFCVRVTKMTNGRHWQEILQVRAVSDWGDEVDRSLRRKKFVNTVDREEFRSYE
jgi:hypothetical protein